MKLIGLIFLFLVLWAVFSMFLGPIIGAGGAVLLAAGIATSGLETVQQRDRRLQQEQIDRVEQLLQKD